jgi:hypothetical protein
MDTNIDNLKRLLENVRSVGFWGRLFGWSQIKDQLIEAAGDLERLLANYENEKGRAALVVQNALDLTKDLSISREDGIKKRFEIDRLLSMTSEDAAKILSLTTVLSSANTSLKNEQEKNSSLSFKNDLLAQKNDQSTGEIRRLSGLEATHTEAVDKLSSRKNELDMEVAGLKTVLANKQEDLKKAKDQVLLFQAEEEPRKREHGEQMATLRQYQDRIQTERDQEMKERHAMEVQRLENLKDTWVRHQDTVKQTMKVLCSRHTIDYVEKVAFKGDPDNTVSICGEFIVFDAKSPKGEDLSNFPTYIKEQAEKAKKYANVENVKKWIFFVVPVSTLEVVKTFVYHLADYQVFVVTVDALEPILLSLKKVEEYDMAEQFSPEDRENICRILGKFAHLSKRRVQVDAYFINQFMQLAYKCESDLPPDVLEKAIEFERAEKLNPPQEKRSKAIAMGDLEKSLTKIQNDAGNKGISLDNSRLTDGLNEVPLYTPT